MPNRPYIEITIWRYSISFGWLSFWIHRDDEWIDLELNRDGGIYSIPFFGNGSFGWTKRSRLPLIHQPWAEMKANRARWDAERRAKLKQWEAEAAADEAKAPDIAINDNTEAA